MGFWIWRAFQFCVFGHPLHRLLLLTGWVTSGNLFWGVPATHPTGPTALGSLIWTMAVCCGPVRCCLTGGHADFGELCHLHLQTFAYLFLRPRDLGLPHSAAKQLSHCRSGRAAFLRLTGIALSCVFPPSCGINCSNNWLHFQAPCLLICLPTGVSL